MLDSTLIRRYVRFPIRTLRYKLLRFQYRMRYGKTDTPVFFANSFPKSGTHLLLQAIQGLAQLGPVIYSGLPAVTMFEAFSGEKRSGAEVAEQLRRLQDGDISYGHVFADPQLVEVLCRPGVVSYFIYRDPRDVVVSHVHYVTEIWTSHVHHDYYANQLKDFDERLRVSILGRPELTEIDFPGIRERFEPYLGWLDQPEVLVIRFEDFIQNKRQTLESILGHAANHGFEFEIETETALDILEKAIDPNLSPTFRSGKVGGWKANFSAEHKELFKRVTGDLLVLLGYEETMDW
jgi:hypothetical protein